MVTNVEFENALPRLAVHPRTGALEWCEWVGWHRNWGLWEFGDGAVAKDMPFNPDFVGNTGELERTLEKIEEGVYEEPAPAFEAPSFEEFEARLEKMKAVFGEI